jgi:polysaccharide biosynthesis transport protein
MDISVEQLLKLIQKNILLIIVCAMIGSAGAYSISKFAIPKTYVSTVKLYVSTQESSQESTANINALDYAQKIVNTYIEMLQTSSFYHKVIDQSKVSDTVDNLRKMVSFSSLNNTEVFQAQVSSHDPNEAKIIADAITTLAPTTISELKENSSLKVVDPAAFPDKPSSPNTVLNTTIGFLLGVIGSIIIVLLRESLNVKIKNEDDLLEKYDIPILASVPAFNTQFARGKNYQKKKAGEK